MPFRKFIVDFRFVICYTVNEFSGEVNFMQTMNYNKLWKMLIDKGMNKKDLRLAAGVSTAVIAKLGKGDNLTTDVLLKICGVLDCDISDICEVVRNDEQNERNK